MEDQSDGISIQNIGGVFIVIFVGIGMACVTLVFEYWWYKYRKGTPKVTHVTESMEPLEHTEHTEKKEMGFMRNRDILEPKNALLRTRITKSNTQQQF